MRSLANRVVIVTGASSGIGRDLAETLAARGATVVGAARNAQRLEQLAGEHGVDVVPTDVSVPEEREKLIARVLERHGRIHALVNNAGIGVNELVADMDRDQVERQIAVNLTGLIDLTRLVLPELLAQGDGDVVNVASVAGQVASPPFSVYAATKHGVRGFTTGLRRELRGSGVRAHLVNPGPVRTEWAVRAQGAEPADGAEEQPHEFGIAPARVTQAIVGCLTAGSSRIVTVPRPLGIARLAEAPVIWRLTDRFARSAATKLY